MSLVFDPAGATNPAVRDVLAWLRALPGPLRDLQPDSRRVAAGDIFVAMPGVVAGKSADGRAFVDAAVARRASAVLVEANGWQARDVAVPVLAVAGLRALAGELAAAFYGDPSRAMTTVAVTGTNGKTSCSQWIAQLFTFAGTRCAVIGTVGTGFPDAPLADAQLTTPDAIGLQRELRRLRDAGAAALAMEASSIGLDQGRLDGMKFDVALFTNLTRDHLDYHSSMAAYETAKARLFDWPHLQTAVINLDDAAGQRLAARLQDTRPDVQWIGHTTAARTSARLRAELVTQTAAGMALRFAFEDRRAELEVPLVGQFNVANLLGVVGCVIACGIDFEQACALLPRLAPPPGRMQRVGGTGEPLAVIDYAHTPDALAQALEALRPLVAARGGKLWAVFGAGGDRDPGKRVLMGAAAKQGAEHVIVTSDNPRTEDPAAIVEAVAAGAPGAQKIVDRAAAIEAALMQADARDVILIAGKGHESYQEVQGVKRPFSDVEQARAALARRAQAPAARGGAGSASGHRYAA